MVTGSRLGDWSLAAVAPVLIFVLTSRERPYQTDFWHHLARGRAIVTEGRLVNQDIFTYSVPSQPLRDPNWLTQVIYYGLYQTGGMTLVRLVNSLTLAAAMAILVFLCWRASGSLPLAAALGVFAVFALLQVFTIRPQTFSFLWFLLLCLVVELGRSRRWLLCLAPAILALWANMHGGFPIGLVLLGAYFVGSVLECWRSPDLEHFLWSRDLALAGAAAFVATWINPYGLGVYSYVGTTSTSAASRGIQEWLPPGTDLLMAKMWVASLLLILVTCSLSPRRPTLGELVLLAVFLPLACNAVRMVAWWQLIAVPIIAAQLGPWLPRPREKEPDKESLAPLLGAAGFAVLLGLVVLWLPGVERLVGQPPRPALSQTATDLEAIADRLRQTPDRGKNVFSRFEWGEYLEWTLHPDGYRVFMDGRIEIYPDEVFDEYLALRGGRADWQELLDHRGVAWLVIDQGDPAFRENLLPLVKKSRKWKQVFQSGDAVLFWREPPEDKVTR